MTPSARGTTCYKIETWANPACGNRDPDFVSGDWEYVDCPDCLDHRPVVQQERRFSTPTTTSPARQTINNTAPIYSERMTFRQGFVFGAGFTLGAFVMSIPIWILVLVLFLAGIFAAQ